MRASSSQTKRALAVHVRGQRARQREFGSMQASPPSAGLAVLDTVVFIIGVAIFGAVLVYFARRIFKEE